MSPFFAAIFLLGLSLANAVNFTTVYEWDLFDFIWPSGADSSNGQIDQNFNPKEVELQYMAVFGERLFLSLNVESGIPATLVWLPKRGTSTAPPKLAPFPSWNLHKKDNCDSIQWARGMETDTDGLLWVLDQGSNNCPSKIWVFNLVKNDKTEHVHQFPPLVVSHLFNERFLLDIVLDKMPDDYLAYITNSESECIVVYNRKSDKSWSIITPGRKWYSLALSANREARQLYLGRYGSNELYSVSVSELENEGGSATVKLIGRWTEYNLYRMVIDSGNVLYAAFFNRNYLSKWNISEPFREQRFHEVGTLGAYRPFTFALDTNDNLWMTERNVTRSGNRFKLLKAAVGARSYQISASTALTTPKAQGTTSRIPNSRIPTEDQNRRIFTTASTRQHSSSPPLTTLPTIYVNGKTAEVEKSFETSTGKTGTPRKDLNSNETSGGCACFAEDYRKSQSLVTILIWLLVFFVVLSGSVIVWLTLRIRRMETSMRRIPMENNCEMYVFPEAKHRE